MDKSILVKAMLANVASPTAEQKAQANSFADAIEAFVKSAAATLVAGSLIAPSGGGPVTQTGPSIATLS